MTTNNLQQTDIFSLFDIEDPYAIKKKKEEEERMKKQAELAKQLEESKNNSTAKAAAETFEVNSDTIIYFYTEQIDINDYFSTEELEMGIPRKNKEKEVEYKPITKADVKNRLKKDLPVLEAGAELVYIKKKNIVSVILQAKKKGNNSRKESDKDSFAVSKRRIPFSLLKDFIAISKRFSDEYGTEVHADIFYDRDTDSFFMDIPKQQAHPLWVEVTETAIEAAEKALEGSYIKCMEIHSHHTMPPIPSLQDNASERAPILYAIVGRIDKFFPELTVRTFDIYSGRHINLDLWSIFEYPFTEVNSNYDLSVVEVIK